jgi:hypothetical protein
MGQLKLLQFVLAQFAVFVGTTEGFGNGFLFQTGFFNVFLKLNVVSLFLID